MKVLVGFFSHMNTEVEKRSNCHHLNGHRISLIRVGQKKGLKGGFLEMLFSFAKVVYVMFSVVIEFRFQAWPGLQNSRKCEISQF